MQLNSYLLQEVSMEGTRRYSPKREEKGSQDSLGISEALSQHRLRILGPGGQAGFPAKVYLVPLLSMFWHSVTQLLPPWLQWAQLWLMLQLQQVQVGSLDGMWEP